MKEFVHYALETVLMMRDINCTAYTDLSIHLVKTTVLLNDYFEDERHC
jgi:hypothetical protein